MSVEDVETLASLALAIGGADETLSNQEEAERTTCERVHKAYSLKTVGSLHKSPLILYSR